MKKLTFISASAALIMLSFTVRLSAITQDAPVDWEKGARMQLSAITKDIPSNWWEGGWDKLYELKNFIREYPDAPNVCAEAQYYIGCYYHSQREYEKAVDEYSKVLKLYPSVAPQCAKAQYEIAQITLYSYNKPQEAIADYQKVITSYPNDPLAPICQLAIGRANSKLGNTAQAKVELQKVIDNYPTAYTQKREAVSDLKEIEGSENKNGPVATKGVLTFPDGGRYEGEIARGRMNGKGVLIYPSGAKYEGEFLDNDFNGKGIYTKSSGDIYEGNFSLSVETGDGVLKYSNGDVFKGQFKYGLYYGKGTLYFARLHGEKPAKSGLWYLGQYIGDKENGSDLLIPVKEEYLNEEKLVSKVLNSGNMEQMSEVDEIFKFADWMLGEGLTNRAMALYEAGLVADNTRFDYQLKLAQLELKNGRSENAAIRAKAICDYAENDDLVNEAKKILDEAGSSKADGTATDPALEPDTQIVLVPVGSINKNIVGEAAKIMQKKLGFTIKLEDEVMELPADKTQDSDSALLKAFGLSQLGRLKTYSRYDAEEIIANLKKKYALRADYKIKEYIGITSSSICAEGSGSIACVSGNKYAAVSYFNYSGETNGYPQNRNLLIKRLGSMCITAALEAINIKHCSTPYCVNSNCNSLRLRDALSLDLCPRCKSDLAFYKKRMKQ